jgi:monofunctional biosynthetic peptidoglycan transglycosylase
MQPIKNTKQPTEKPNSSINPTFWVRARRLAWKILLWFLISSNVSVIALRFLPVLFTPLMIQRSIENKWASKKVPFKYNWVALEDISPNMARAVITSEDQRFETHNGFDGEALSKAWKRYFNKRKKKVIGGSTISQQTAKNVWLLPNRTLVRKAFEAYFTLLIELYWPKERIMEVYLNVIEMGDGIYGADAASEYYYGHSAKQMSTKEAALIAAVLPNPRLYKVKNPTPKIVRRQTKIAAIMRRLPKPSWQEKR